VVHVQTIEKMNLETTGTEKGGKVKETERLRPKIIGREIVDPRIYQDQFRSHNMPIRTQWIQMVFRLTQQP
jgi:hypothetical protein